MTDLKDGAEIYRQSFAIIEAETDLARVPAELRAAAIRMVHASGQPDLVEDLAWSDGFADAATAALRAGAPILCDAEMVRSGVTRTRLPADNEVICTLRDPAVPDLATQWGTTRAAAAVSLWGPRLEGAVVAIGNAPTALFHLLEIILDGGPRPAAIVGMPVGFIGSAESKLALAEHRLPEGGQIPWLVVHGRRGGSAMAASALNALANASELA